MGFFKLSEQQKKTKAEKKAFRQIVKTKTTQVARQAFSKEAVKVATERGKAKARRPSILSQVGGAALKQATKKPIRSRGKSSTKKQSTGFNINDLL